MGRGERSGGGGGGNEAGRRKKNTRILPNSFYHSWSAIQKTIVSSIEKHLLVKYPQPLQGDQRLPFSVYGVLSDRCINISIISIITTIIITIIIITSITTTIITIISIITTISMTIIIDSPSYSTYRSEFFFLHISTHSVFHQLFEKSAIVPTIINGKKR